MTFALKMRKEIITNIVNYLLTYSTVQSPSWEANRFAASQEIPHILWNSKFHYRTQKCPPPVPILCQLDPVHALTSHFLKIYLNNILPSAPGSPQWFLSFRFPHQNRVHASPLSHTRHMPSPSHSSWFYHSQNIGWAVQVIKFFISFSIEKIPCSYCALSVPTNLLHPH